MGFPTFGSFDLDDGTQYITTSITGDRNAPDREIRIESIPRREGSRITDVEYGSKVFVVNGWINSPTVSGFNTLLDNLKKNLRLKDQTLQFVPDRSYTATVRSIDVTQNPNNLSSAQYSVEFVTAGAFAKGTNQSVTVTVTSGNTTVDTTVTISGTVFTRPTIKYVAPDGDGSGSTTISGISVNHVPTGTTVTWSGSGTPLTYSGTVTFNYNNLTVLKDATTQDFTGIFETWDIGDNNFTTTFSGTAVGGEIQFSYSPRYL